MRERVAAGFAARYGRAPELIVRSPGRVNLIGDHTDYNDGFVMPIAIAQATWIAAGARPDRRVAVTSPGHGDAMIDLDRLVPTHTWVDYIAGTLLETGDGLDEGFDAYVCSDVPVGAGLSSSASIELAVARVVTVFSEAPWDPVEAALAAQRAERGFVGMPCGIMDQLIVATGRPGHALLIDCRSLESQPAPVPADTSVVVLDTGTRRRLVESGYDDRRTACERAAAVLDVPALRDATLAMVEAGPLDPELRRRARHVVAENDRTVAAAEFLASGDVAAVGRLMDESHASLRDDFEVSSATLDAITDIARSHDGCFGARLTGGGFAGCAVALVATEALDGFIGTVGPAYDAATGETSVLYPTQPASGVGVV